MKAPNHERAELLSAAIQCAVQHLNAPITRIEVTPEKVLCWAGGRVLTMSYGHAQGLNEQGVPLAGSGDWWVSVDGEVPASEGNKVPEALGRMAGRWLRGKGLST